MRLSPPVAPVAIQTATRLRRQLAAGSQVDASHFWREANSLALPLVTAINDADDEREVTFLWRAASPLRGVYVRLNRVTDKDNVAKGMMTQLPTTDIWHLTLRLPASYCGSYTMVEIPPETPDETVLQLGSRFASLVGKADPLNSTPGINVRGNAQESVLALDHAPAQEEWSGCRAYAGQLFTSEHRLAGQRRRVRLYLPDVPVVQPLGLLVLTDGEIWFDHLGVSAAIDAAIRSGRIAPVAVLGIDNINARERVAILGGRRELVLDIAERLLPTLRAKYPGTAVGGPYTNGAGRAKPRRRDRADGGPPRARELRPGAEPLPPQCGGRRTTAIARTISAQKSAHGSANMCYPRPRQPYVRICAWDRWKVRRSRRSNSCMKNCAPPASKAIAACTPAVTIMPGGAAR